MSIESEPGGKQNLRHPGLKQSTPLRDAANVFITLTMTPAAAADVASTLAKLSELLNIKPPATFKVTEPRGPPTPLISQKLGLYRNKSKDGKEGGESCYIRRMFP